jgi:hypothetical protein
MPVAAAAICIHQMLVAYFIIFDGVPAASEARLAKRGISTSLSLTKEITR